MADVERTKYVPSLVVKSDDLVVQDDEGTEYHPHAGEWVRLRRSVSLRSVRVAQLAQETSAEDVTSYAALIEALIGILKRQIIAWSWTDENSEPMPKPGTPEFVEALWDLADYELHWLSAHMADGANVSPN